MYTTCCNSYKTGILVTVFLSVPFGSCNKLRLLPPPPPQNSPHCLCNGNRVRSLWGTNFQFWSFKWFKTYVHGSSWFPSQRKQKWFPCAVQRRWKNSSLLLKKVKVSRCRPGVAQRVGRGIALLFHDRGTRRGWVVSSTPWPPLPPGKSR